MQCHVYNTIQKGYVARSSQEAWTVYNLRGELFKCPIALQNSQKASSTGTYTHTHANAFTEVTTHSWKLIAVINFEKDKTKTKKPRSYSYCILSKTKQKNSVGVATSKTSSNRRSMGGGKQHIRAYDNFVADFRFQSHITRRQNERLSKQMAKEATRSKWWRNACSWLVQRPPRDVVQFKPCWSWCQQWRLSLSWSDEREKEKKKKKKKASQQAI